MQFPHTLTFYADETNASPVLTLSLARAVTFSQRLRGLLFHPAPPEGHALLIEHCNAVHTIGMRYPLDLIFLDRNHRILRIRPNVPPNRPFILGGFRAASVLEATSGWLPLDLLCSGMRVVITEI